MQTPSHTPAECPVDAVQPVAAERQPVGFRYLPMDADQLGYWRETMKRARMYAKAARFALKEGYGAMYAQIACSLYREAAMFRDSFWVQS